MRRDANYLDEELDALLQDNVCETVAVLYDYRSGELLLFSGKHSSSSSSS